MKIEDIINIKKDNIEEKIEDAIEDTKEELNDLTTERTCLIYSDYLSRNLYDKHVANKIVSTTKYNYPYNHQFNIVPKNEDEFYLIDLTYSQFQSDKFDELEEKGYMLLKNNQYEDYLEIVGNANKDIRLKH